MSDTYLGRTLIKLRLTKNDEGENQIRWWLRTDQQVLSNDWEEGQSEGHGDIR